MPKSSITDKVAIITGASSGIGRSVAVNFARQGCRLALTGRNSDNLQLTKSQCIEEGLAVDNILTILAEMKNNEDLDRIVNLTLEKFSQIDILINNAGMLYVVATFEQESMEQYREVMRVNVDAPVYLTKLCIPHLEKTRGSIVNVSSVSSLCPFPMLGAYGLSKAALDQFTRSLALDLGPKGIRVNSVNPAAIETDILTRSGILDAETFRAGLEAMRAAFALGRWGQVEDVAGVVSFLVSDGAGQTTGATMFIDGALSKMVNRT